MRERELQERIVEFIKSRGDKPPSIKEINDGVELRGKNRKRLQKLLAELEYQGRIVRIRNDRYAIGQSVDLITGTLSVNKAGNGFVSTPGGQDIFVPREELGTALPGDRVVIRLTPPRSKEKRGGADSASGRGGKAARRGKSDAGRESQRNRRGPQAGPTAGKPAVEPPAGGRQEGTVTQVLLRGRVDIVGTLRSTGRFFFVVPISTAYKKNFYVPDSAGAKPGDRVVIRFQEWNNEHVNPEAEIVEVLGPEDNPSLDTLAVMRHFDLPEAFPEEVVAEAEHVAEFLERPGERTDMRGKLIITIDPERAKDFDDALSLEPDGHDGLLLGVHIADVSHFVRPGSKLDLEARKRGNSAYLPDKVIPMLPEQLSNGVCSLKPRTDRLAFSVMMRIDRHGKVRDATFHKSIIRSAHRLTYEQVMDTLKKAESRGSATRGQIAGIPAEVVDLLVKLDDVAQRLRRRRTSDFALDLDLPECEIQLGQDGTIESVRLVASDRSHQLVEECMVLTNETIARELANRRIPSLYRLHEPPAPEKIEMLTADLQALGFEPGDLTHPRNLASFLKSVADHPLAHHVRVSVLRSMKRALYSGSAMGHFGLGKKHYSHFTSPIRRYPDLAVHRQLAACMGLATGAQLGARILQAPDSRGGYVHTREELVELAFQCSATEQNADEAERNLTEMKKLRYLDEQLKSGKPTVYEAVIVDVTNFGLFVEVPALQIQGLLHVKSISDRFVRYDKHLQALKSGRKTYRIGVTVNVRVNEVDFEKRRVCFAMG